MSNPNDDFIYIKKTDWQKLVKNRKLSLRLSWLSLALAILYAAQIVWSRL